eukprot:COSAG02_NODE_30649_length_547_cov_1.171875_1_plen_59_part_10
MAAGLAALRVVQGKAHEVANVSNALRADTPLLASVARSASFPTLLVTATRAVCHAQLGL